MDKGWKRRVVSVLLYGVFAFYILLLGLALFGKYHGPRSGNLVPLRSILAFITGTDLATGSTVYAGFIRGLALSNILGNIVLFIPLGVYITLFNKDKSIWKNALLVTAVSVAVELVQIIFILGIGDIDDVLLNGLGGLLGVLLCRGLYRLCKGRDEKARGVVAVLAPAVGILSFAVLILQNQ